MTARAGAPPPSARWQPLQSRTGGWRRSGTRHRPPPATPRLAFQLSLVVDFLGAPLLARIAEACFAHHDTCTALQQGCRQSACLAVSPTSVPADCLSHRLQAERAAAAEALAALTERHAEVRDEAASLRAAAAQVGAHLLQHTCCSMECIKRNPRIDRLVASHHPAATCRGLQSTSRKNTFQKP